MKSKALAEDELEERLCACLEAVQLDYLLGRGRGWDQVQPWDETLSGGEKQRLAMARLLFHAPKYAILDEATSAVSADGEAVFVHSMRPGWHHNAVHRSQTRPQRFSLYCLALGRTRWRQRVAHRRNRVTWYGALRLQNISTIDMQCGSPIERCVAFVLSIFPPLHHSGLRIITCNMT
eukprot:jgi/Picre1/30441/NNA_005805.t1